MNICGGSHERIDRQHLLNIRMANESREGNLQKHRKADFRIYSELSLRQQSNGQARRKPC